MSDQTPEGLRSAAAQSRKSANDLLAQYGYGVRPSWVSADLEIEYDRARRLEREADQLEIAQHTQAQVKADAGRKDT